MHRRIKTLAQVTQVYKLKINSQRTSVCIFVRAHTNDRRYTYIPYSNGLLGVWGQGGIDGKVHIGRWKGAFSSLSSMVQSNGFNRHPSFLIILVCI